MKIEKLHLTNNKNTVLLEQLKVLGQNNKTYKMADEKPLFTNSKNLSEPMKLDFFNQKYLQYRTF